MNVQSMSARGCLAVAAVSLCAGVPAFESGSTGADGVFSPTADIEVVLPASGVFHFTDVNVPTGVTVTFTRNAANTPVRMLASGNVIIDGTVSVDGSPGQSGASGGQPGLGGPGGYDGGRGGLRTGSLLREGGDGIGPGAGTGGPVGCSFSVICHAGSAGFGSPGASSPRPNGTQGRGGPAYGNVALLPLIGGSGGGGGTGNGQHGAGGGGGGGALLVAASGTVTINGAVTALQGFGANGLSLSGNGGSGSGGAIRVVATTVQGEGNISASNGRVRIETENLLRVSTTSPAYTFSSPQVVLVADAPQLRIASIGSEAAPPAPTGFRDVVLPGITTNPVNVVVETANVPLSSIVTVRATPERGISVSANGSGVTGSLAFGADTVSINLPGGNSYLTAQASFTITAELGDRFAPFSQGERVARIELSTSGGADSQTTYVTVSGKRFTWGPQGRVN
jgi:hypothetical protein